jgi:hypothetical protein
MKNRRFAVTKLAAAILLVATALLVAAPSAFAVVRLPGGVVPFYARISSTEIYHTDEWAAVVFYRPPTCIPAGFNLLDFFDVPAAFDCNPPTTTGFELWDTGPTDPAPKLTELKALGAVPIWFVSWPALQSAIADGELTIGELESLNPRVGAASFYQETLRPTGVVNVSTFEANATGTLEKGGSFRFHAASVSGPGVIAECGVLCLTQIVFN